MQIHVYPERRKQDKFDRLIVFIHGGAWVSGSVENVSDTCRALACRTDIPVVAVSYRKSGIAPSYLRTVLCLQLVVLLIIGKSTSSRVITVVCVILCVFMSVLLLTYLFDDANQRRVIHPAHVEDVSAAIARAVDEHGVGRDNTELIICGHSAGAHLAALVSLAGRFLAKHDISVNRIRGCVCLSGVYSLAITRASVAKLLLSSVFGDVDDTVDTVFNDTAIGGKISHATVVDAFPLAHVAPNCCPFFIAIGGGEFALNTHARDFAMGIRDVGGMVTVKRYEHKSHLSIRKDWERADDEVGMDVSNFIRQLV